MKKNRRFISLFVCGLLTATAVTTSSISVNAAPKVNPYNTVQAELLFESQGVEKAAEIYNNQKITVLNSIEAGDFWKVNDVDFSDGLSKISIAARSEGMGLIEVREGAVDGTVLGNIKISNTNGEFKTFSASMKNIEGKHTIFFVGKMGNVSADYWVAEAATVVEPTPTPTPEPTPDCQVHKKP